MMAQQVRHVAPSLPVRQLLVVLLLLMTMVPCTTGMGVTKTVMISLNPTEATKAVMRDFQRVLGSPEGEIFRGIRGVPPNMTLNLFTRFLLDNPCSDLAGDVIRTSGMVGCFLSHLHVLRQLRPGDVFAVLEDDARLLAGGDQLLQDLLPFIRGADFHVLKLQTLPHDRRGMVLHRVSIPASASVQLEFCTGKNCWVEGAMAYIVTFAGAQLLLRHAENSLVQFDSLVSLVSNYEPGFKLYWTHPDLVYGAIHMSTVQELCLWKTVNIEAWSFHLLWVSCFLILMGLVFVAHLKNRV